MDHNAPHLGLPPAIGSAIINAAIGNPRNDIVDWEVMEKQLTIIRDEFNELIASVQRRNYNELRDGINDARFTVDGAAWRMGIDVDVDFDALMTSQMSKFDTTVEDALISQRTYADKGVVTEWHAMKLFGTGQDYYVQISAIDQVVAGKNYPKGKFLKSYQFKEPVYLVPENARVGTFVIPPMGDTPIVDSMYQLIIPEQYRSGVDLNECDAIIAQIRTGDNGNKTVINWAQAGDGVVVIKPAEFSLIDVEKPLFRINRIAETDKFQVQNLCDWELHIDVVALLTQVDLDKMPEWTLRQVPVIDLDSYEVI